MTINNDKFDVGLMREIFDCDNITVSKINNKYGTNDNVFRVLNKGNSFFVKIVGNKSAKRSVENYDLIKKFLPTPKLVQYKRFQDSTALVYEYVENRLMTDLVLWNEDG